MKHLTNFLYASAAFFTGGYKEKTLIISIFILLLLCSLTLRVMRTAQHRGTAVNTDDIPVTGIPMTPTITATKWWIKMTATVSRSMLSVSTSSVESKTSRCSETSTSTLRAQIFAYVALDPPLPNRLRTKASLSGEYTGQIESGVGLRVIDGPICADGYSWWLVESLDKRLRGWTVEGSDSEQWLIPCPNVDAQCSFLATPTPQKAIPSDDNPAKPPENTCNSDQLTVGLLTHVDQDSLLVIRAEPSVGAVIGHAGPMSIVNILEGPSCIGATIWWKVNALDLGLIGWTTENYLEPCLKDSQCDNLDPS